MNSEFFSDKRYPLPEIIKKFQNYQNVKNFSEANQKHYKKTFNVFFKAVPMEFLDEFTPESINDFIYRRSGSIKNVTIMSYLKDLRAFYNWLIKKKYKTGNRDWFEEIDKPVVINEGIKYISKEDLSIFHNHVMMNRKFETEFQMYLYQAIFMTYMWCGTRFNETRKILRNNVELENRIIWLEAADNKSKRKDQVPIHSNLYPILKKYIQRRDAEGGNNPYLFFYKTKDRPISEKTLRRWMDKIKTTMQSKYQVKSPIRFHAMRHSLGHFSVKSGVDLPTVQKLLRHSSPDITAKYYVHTGNKELLEGIERYNPLAN